MILALRTFHHTHIFMVSIAGKFGGENVWRIFFQVFGGKKFGEWICRSVKGLSMVTTNLVWQITDDLPNSLPAKLSCFSVIISYNIIQCLNGSEVSNWITWCGKQFQSLITHGEKQKFIWINSCIQVDEFIGGTSGKGREIN